jgi:hypothetical protein
MYQKKVTLKAGIPTPVVTTGFTQLIIVKVNKEADLEIELRSEVTTIGKLSSVLRKGAKFKFPDGMASMLMTSSADAVVEYIVTTGDADINLVDGAELKAEITNTDANPVPTKIVNVPHVVVDSGNITAHVDNFPQNQNVTVTNTPHVVVDSGNITAVIDQSAGALKVEGNVTVTSGNITATIGNFPQNQNVTITGGNNITATINQSGGALLVEGNMTISGGSINAALVIDPAAAPLAVKLPKPVQGTQTQDRYSQDDNLAMFQPFDETRVRWTIQNVSDWKILLGIGTQDMQDHNATMELDAGERYIEDNPLVAAQEIYLRTLSDISVGGFPNGSTALFTYQDLKVA